MSLTLVDHVLALILVVLAPWYGARSYRSLLARLRAGAVDARLREYRQTIVHQWLLAGVTVVVWVAAGRALAGLGLVVPGGWRGGAGVLITLLGIAFLLAQLRAVERLDAAGMARLGEQVAPVADLLPGNAREVAWFRMLSVTAGICEELAYRGFLIAYFAAFVGIWPAAVVAGLVFGVAHAYQGAAGVVKTGVSGVLAGLIYVGTGSLLWPMLLHASTDLQGLEVGRRVLAATRGANDAAV